VKAVGVPEGAPAQVGIYKKPLVALVANAAVPTTTLFALVMVRYWFAPSSSLLAVVAVMKYFASALS